MLISAVGRLNLWLSSHDNFIRNHYEVLRHFTDNDFSPGLEGAPSPHAIVQKNPHQYFSCEREYRQYIYARSLDRATNGPIQAIYNKQFISGNCWQGDENLGDPNKFLDTLTRQIHELGLLGIVCCSIKNILGCIIGSMFAAFVPTMVMMIPLWASSIIGIKFIFDLARALVFLLFISYAHYAEIQNIPWVKRFNNKAFNIGFTASNWTIGTLLSLSWATTALACTAIYTIHVGIMAGASLCYGACWHMAFLIQQRNQGARGAWVGSNGQSWNQATGQWVSPEVRRQRPAPVGMAQEEVRYSNQSQTTPLFYSSINRREVNPDSIINMKEGCPISYNQGKEIGKPICIPTNKKGLYHIYEFESIYEWYLIAPRPLDPKTHQQRPPQNPATGEMTLDPKKWFVPVFAG